MKEKFFKKFEGFNGPFALQMLSVEKINDFAGDKLIKNEFYFYKDNYLTIYIYQDDINRVRNFGIGKLKDNSAYFDNLCKITISKFDDFKKKELNFIKDINSISKVEDLKAWIKQFGDYVSGVTIIGYMVEMFAGYDNYWLDYIAINKEDFTALTAPEEFSFAREYEYELAKIKLGKSSKRIDDVARKWYWLLNNYFIIDIVDGNKVKEQLDKMTETEAHKIIDDVDNSISEIKNKKENLLKKLGLDDFKVTILRTLSEFVVLQDKRKEVVLKTMSIFSKACNKLIDMYGFSQAEKSIILATALYKWFYSLDKEQLLEQSKLASEGLYYPIIGDIILGRDAINKMEQEIDETKNHHDNEIKGQVAYRGKINGRAIVVIRNEDFSKFKEGDVLVTSMTRPEFIPLMKKASAFITDEGGITCHAAIVAREMKKPCIIGTKIATQVLHDGDLVEVDADNGVVRIIKRAGEKSENIQGELITTLMNNINQSNDQKELVELVHADFPLMMAEFTDYGESQKNIPWSKETFEFKPYCVFMRKDDQLYFYYEKTGIDWKTQQAGKFNKEKMKNKALEGYYLVQDVVLKEKFLTKKELRKFFQVLKEYWTWWDCMWWMIEYYDQNKLPLEYVLAVRKETEYLAPGIAMVMRNSVSKLYPKKKKFADVLLSEEVLSGNIPTDEVLEERLNRNIAYANGKIYPSFADVQKKFNVKIKEVVIQNNSKELKGRIAYPGIVTGKVKIIGGRRNFGEFGKGEILVAATTTPDFLPIMKKAIAIISEQGGVVCHASITSRELKIPCIVWVKLATQVLHDGDLVEVDADKGVVRILEKAGEKSEDTQSRPITTLDGKKHNKEKEIIFDKFLSRPYSVLQIEAYNRFLTEISEEIGCPATYPIFVYDSTQGLVHLYCNMAELTPLIGKIGEKISSDNEFRKNIFSKLTEVFESIKKYFDGDLSIKTVEELQSFWELFKDYFKYVAYTWVLPGLDFVPKKIKDEAMKIRKKTEFYAGRRDNIMPEFVASMIDNRLVDPSFLSLDEIKKMDRDFEKITKERSKGFLFYLGEIVSSDKISDFLRSKNFILREPEVIDSLEIKGMIAQKGFVKGIARIVYTEKDLKKISSSNDILVSPMTRPEFVPAMKIAGAVVTDEGGVVCHAAIVAREMKKPCIIGTKIATQVLHDGDLVEVDADKGVVRIIKRK